MTPEQFKSYWNKTYPDSYPIDWEMKHMFNDRWFRIHSLPDSKRYAENNDEYQEILDRQNTLITDLIDSSNILIVTGLYKMDFNEILEDDYFDLSEFIKMDTLALHKIRPDENDDGEMYYDIFLKTDTWMRNKFNDMLRKIADDETRAMILCPSKNIAIVPYDGGMDIILPDETTRDVFKNKYSSWLSKREDGL